jgi:phosphohistidine phosphatase
MKRLLRHAKSDWKDPDLPDHDRPLNKRGKHDAPLMGKLLKDEDLKPDLIVSSPATRAKKTAELVAKRCRYKGEIVINQALYEAEPKDYLKILEGLSVTYKTVLMVGHSPTIEETIEMITNSSDVIMPTCALAHIRLPIENWADINKQKIRENWLRYGNHLKVHLTYNKLAFYCIIIVCFYFKAHFQDKTCHKLVDMIAIASP